MAETGDPFNITGGMDVVGADDEKVGDVADVQGDYVVVRKGFFLPTDYYIPISAIGAVSDKVHLNVPRDEALDQGWDSALTTLSSGDERQSIDVGLHVENPIPETVATDDDSSSAPHDSDAFRAGLADEALTAQSPPVAPGSVDENTVASQAQHELDSPVTREGVNVVTRVVDRMVPPGDTAFDESTIEITLRGEEVETVKRARIREEVEIGKDAVTRTERVTDTVRREEAHVSGNADQVAEDVDRHRR